MLKSTYFSIASLIKASEIERRPYRFVAIIVAAILFGSLINKTIDKPIYSEKQEFSVDQYGKHFASIISDRVTHSVLQKDAISIQAIVQNILNTSAINAIIVYDNNNQILAQALNEQPETSNADKEYSSPIISNENIIGSIAITINPKGLTTNNTQANYFLWLLAALLCGSLAVDCIKKAPKTQTTTTKKESEQENNEATLYKKEAEVQQFCTVVKLHNNTTLYQQINNDLRQQQIALLKENIGHALRLYGGKPVVINDQCIVLVFDNTPIENIIYGSQLLLALHQHQKKSLIELSAVILSHSDDKNIPQQLMQSQSFSKTEKAFEIYIQQEIIEQCELKKYVEYAEVKDTEFAVKVDQLKPHYQKLINNQIEQLLRNQTPS